MRFRSLHHRAKHQAILLLSSAASNSSSKTDRICPASRHSLVVSRIVNFPVRTEEFQNEKKNKKKQSSPQQRCGHERVPGTRPSVSPSRSIHVDAPCSSRRIHASLTSPHDNIGSPRKSLSRMPRAEISNTLLWILVLLYGGSRGNRSKAPGRRAKAAAQIDIETRSVGFRDLHYNLADEGRASGIPRFRASQRRI